MSVETSLLVYEDYLALPEMRQRYEIIDGEMIMAPAPTPEHQWTLGNAYMQFRAFVESRQLGIVLFAPVDVLIARDPLRVRQPDLLYLSAERLGNLTLTEVLKRNPLDIAPDLVVEILSPTNTRIDMESKCTDYSTIGVRECWLVSPEARTVEVLRLTPRSIETLGIYGTGWIARSAVLPELEFPVNTIFA
ncbi:MAG: Uma2 family endonuclease [Candidatus Latescibacteria bacterium]|nr:Uma2 family endonuclease [Candidatus Latescibacterota bacterium]